MDVAALLLTHVAARNSGKAPFFFSRWTFDSANKRGNTHYCFHCGGDWGFTPGKNGEATNCEDDKVTLYRNDERVLIAEALENPMLEPHITDSPGYPRRKPEHRDYEEWLGYTADFDYSSEFVLSAEKAGFVVRRYNSMRHHDPETHAEAVVDGIQNHKWAHDWFRSIKVPESFPYVVTLR